MLPDAVVRAGSWTLDRSLPTRRANLSTAQFYEQSSRIVSELIRRHGGVVQGGPFAGMRLAPARATGSIHTLLVGSYEEELHAVLEQLIAAGPPRIVNVGCAEGYYAVGLAVRLPDADVYAFDVNERARQLTRENAQINGITERVHVAGACTVERLEQLLMTQSLVLMDCEGCELDLLRPESAPSLRNAVLLVELHSSTSVILARFAPTHSYRLFNSRPRNPSDYPVVQDLDPADRPTAVYERRPPGQWVVLWPLSETPPVARPDLGF